MLVGIPEPLLILSILVLVIVSGFSSSS